MFENPMLFGNFLCNEKLFWDSFVPIIINGLRFHDALNFVENVYEDAQLPRIFSYRAKRTFGIEFRKNDLRSV